MSNNSSDSASKRRFLRSSLVLGGAAFVEQLAPFLKFIPSGWMPIASAQTATESASAPTAQPNLDVLGKEKADLRLLNDRPLNAETPAHLLDDAITPASRLFVRNNGIPPTQVDPHTWQLSIGGEACIKPVTFTLAQLKSSFKHYSYQLTLECGGNGRSEFSPSASGNQWTTGAVGCPVWTGIRLKDVLARVGYKDNAVYIGYQGADTHLSGDPSKSAISRGVPMHKALEEESLVAWEMNGEPIPAHHGYPLRLVCGGWPASVSGKWLTQLLIRDRVHDGAKMGGKSYRVPCQPVAPGSAVADEDMCIIESMPIKSLITSPKSGLHHPLTKSLDIAGHAWAGDREVANVVYSVDFGATWQPTKLANPVNRFAWQRWQAQVKFPQAGYYEVWVRATDDRGVSQPLVIPGWNPKGYLNNAAHRIAVKVVGA